MDRLDCKKALREFMDQIPGGIGIFNVYEDGTFELVYLNDGYYELIGTKREERKQYKGFGAMDAIPLESRSALTAALKSAMQGDGAFSITLPNQGIEEQKKWLKVQGKIVQRTKKKCVFYVSYTDVTDYERTTEELKRSQAEIEIATSRIGILYWIYDAHTHQTVITKGTGYGYETFIDNVPECFRGTGDIYSKDEELYFNLFEQMERGVDTCETYARVYNHTLNIYQWQHIVFTKLSEKRYVGSSMDVTEQKRAEQQYNNEIALCNELLGNSVFSYRMNLTKGIIEHMKMKYASRENEKMPFPLTEAKWNEVVDTYIEEKYRDEFRSKFSMGELLKSWDNGETTVTIPAVRVRFKDSVRWMKASVTMMKRPATGEIVAVTYMNDIDNVMNNQLAVERAVAEEMEFIALINADTEKVRLVTARSDQYLIPSVDKTDFETYRNSKILVHVLPEEREELARDYTVAKMREGLEKDGVYTLTYRSMEEEGTVRRKKLRMFYLDEQRKWIVLARRDITDLYNEEVRQGEVLQQALQVAKEANESKTTFFSQMSHDMRTPMNGILGLTELMKDKNDIEDIKHDLEQVELSGHYLLNLINDTLDINKIEAGKLELHLKPINSEEVFMNILNTAGLMAKEKDINMNIQIPQIGHGCWKTVDADASRLEQIFMNIISNAVKYTPVGGKIDITMESLSITEDTVSDRYIIRDTGIGMSEEFLPHLFETFSQEGRMNTDRQNGTGLGMSIVKKLIDMMHGTIEVKSKMNVGTEVTICLKYPISKETVERESSKQIDLTILEGKKALLCEDHPLNSRIAVHLLEKMHMEVITAENGEKGLEIFADSQLNEYAVILMDVRMPVMDGIRATKEIRKLKRKDATTIPIIAMTANAFDEDVQNCLDAGMNEHLSKPFEVDKLYTTIAQMIGKTVGKPVKGDENYEQADGTDCR